MRSLATETPGQQSPPFGWSVPVYACSGWRVRVNYKPIFQNAVETRPECAPARAVRSGFDSGLTYVECGSEIHCRSSYQSHAFFFIDLNALLDLIALLTEESASVGRVVSNSPAIQPPAQRPVKDTPDYSIPQNLGIPNRTRRACRQLVNDATPKSRSRQSRFTQSISTKRRRLRSSSSLNQSPTCRLPFVDKRMDPTMSFERREILSARLSRRSCCNTTLPESEQRHSCPSKSEDGFVDDKHGQRDSMNCFRRKTAIRVS